MSRRLVITPVADRDLEEIATYIGNEDPAAAARFIATTTHAFRDLLNMPQVGARVGASDSRLSGLRRRRVPRFGIYLIFYRVTDEAVEIIRVLHGARDIERIRDSES